MTIPDLSGYYDQGGESEDRYRTGGEAVGAGRTTTSSHVMARELVGWRNREIGCHNGGAMDNQFRYGHRIDG